MSTTKEFCKTLVASLCCLLFTSACPSMWAQAPNSSPQLVITILDGEGALNDIRQRTAREPIIEVENENNKPVAGAAVLFLLPNSGPSGAFADGTQAFSTLTDGAGRAVAQGLRPNNTAGSYNIHVKVNFNGSSAEATIHQKNVSGSSSESQNNTSESSPVASQVTHGLSLKALLIIVGAAAAAGTAAAIILTRSSNPTVVTAGPPTVGPPTGTGTTGGIRIQLQLHRHNR
jgi:hypothetical protein